MRRVIAQGDLRPMAGRDAALSDLRAILREREPLYRRADLHMNTSGQKVAACVERLCRLPGD
jgi:XRE family aerobic/anaerobic benzoate catabolism transcriptional regulator